MRNEHSIGPPLALMIGGFAAGFASLYGGFLFWLEGEEGFGRDEQETRLMRAGLVMGGIFVSVGLGGLIFLRSRLAERRVYAPELKRLKQERRDLQQRLRFGGYYTGQAGYFGSSLSF